MTEATDLVSVSAVARALNLPRTTLSGWARRGQAKCPPVLVIDRRRGFDREAVTEWAEMLFFEKIDLPLRLSGRSERE